MLIDPVSDHLRMAYFRNAKTFENASSKFYDSIVKRLVRLDSVIEIVREHADGFVSITILGMERITEVTIIAMASSSNVYASTLI